MTAPTGPAATPGGGGRAPGAGARSLEEHLAVVLEGAGPLPARRLPLLEALDLVLAEDVVAAEPLPRFDGSSMDGYAVLAPDVAGAGEGSPAVLDVVGDVPAGAADVPRLRPGAAVRVMTGAPVPVAEDPAATADVAVVQVEWTDAAQTGPPPARVAVRRPVAAGRNVRRAGEDVAAGERVLRPGERLSPRHLGLLASLGRADVLVHPRPRVLVLSTGSEVVEPGEPLGPGQIHDSNSTALVAACREAGALARRVRAVEDDPARLLAVLRAELATADLVLTTGGVSAGAYEVVKEALAADGAVDFVRVAMQPGGPQGAGWLADDAGRPVRVLTLPGNPVSAYVSFEAFVRPLLRVVLGEEERGRPVVEAVVERGWTSVAGKRQLYRVRLERGEDGVARVGAIGGPGSHLVADLVTATALAVVPEDVVAVEPGTTLTCMLLERGGQPSAVGGPASPPATSPRVTDR
ncbi:gephyrin-like molybdotransferase Glp [uncultured Pseudokineococcus sp.]|uniref:molybdopterin molybdotransferase MoeA n=1 Tax=uncultured Pseudokineococcus sp. TaxID=1642928 RepID=UPI00261A0E37|nr:gephyrin-like molybdotransferase Glp [uncultured Pseudokineococcus sp.]